jgi:ribonuclease P/MRP protein subunit RPP1
MPPKSTFSIPDLKVLHRLTIVLDDAALQHQIMNMTPAHQAWDIIAVKPTTEKSFGLACEKAETDIICVDLDDRLPFKLRPQQLRTAIARGVVFELCCAGLLKGIEFSVDYGIAFVDHPSSLDSGARRFAIGNARSITRIASRRGVILTSGATEPLLLRAPLEICALCV